MLYFEVKTFLNSCKTAEKDKNECCVPGKFRGDTDRVRGKDRIIFC